MEFKALGRNRRTNMMETETLKNMDRRSVVRRDIWATLPIHEQQWQWQTHFGMTEDLFEALFAILEPHIKRVGHSRYEAYRTYTNKCTHKFVMLAFCPHLRELSTKFGCPHISQSVSVLPHALNEMYQCVFVDGETKVIQFPQPIACRPNQPIWRALWLYSFRFFVTFGGQWH